MRPMGAQEGPTPGGPSAYLCAQGVLFAKRSADPASSGIVQLKRAPGSTVGVTGRLWTGPSGGVWAELDESRGEKGGWVLVEGPGFGLIGPALTALADPLLAESPPSPRAEARAGVGPAEGGHEEDGHPSVYALSDLHADYPANMELFRELPARPRDAIILAGDISHDLGILRETLGLFAAKYRHVFYTPGNHELWCHKSDGCEDSLEKLQKILALCAELGVRTKPEEIGGGVLIVPLLSWYERGFDTDPDVVDEGLTPVEKTMSDFHLCRWPRGLSATDGTLAAHFDGLNDPLPDLSGSRTVISFSHFVPRPELLPEKRYLYYPPLAGAVGSRALGERVRRIRPSVHVFGHTHYGWDAELDGVRYLQPAVAYPREREKRGFALRLEAGGAAGGAGGADGGAAGGVVAPVLVFDAERRELPRRAAFWSSYYARHPRRPKDVRWLYRAPRKLEDLGPVLRRLVDSGEVVDDDVVASLIRA